MFADFVTSCKRPTNKQHNILPISDVNKLEYSFFFIGNFIFSTIETLSLHWVSVVDDLNWFASLRNKFHLIAPEKVGDMTTIKKYSLQVL